jgi:hypothetical protein
MVLAAERYPIKASASRESRFFELASSLFE